VTEECWDLAGRDVVPDLAVRGSPNDVGAAILHALLRSDGTKWAPPYEEVRSKLGIRKKVIEPEREEQADSRLRTYFTLFRGLGLLYDEDGTIRVTPAGERLARIFDEMFVSVDDAARDASRSTRWKLARLAVSTLARYQLRNPKTADRYPKDADIHPLWAIWKAMRELDDKIHWEEIGRVLTRCLRMADLDKAIDRIREARATPGYDPNDPNNAEAPLGARCPDLGDDQQDRIIVWMSRAGFKDILLEHRNRDDGYRYLQAEFVPLLDEALANPPEYREFATAEEYYGWVGAGPPGAEWGAAQPAEEDPVLQQVVERVQQFGDRAIVALVGAAGTGKTRQAYRAAHVLAGGDDSRVELIQFHAAFTYEEFVGGLGPAPGGVGFEPTPGVLLRINQKARDDPENRYVLVIDELSRADVANVLGELLTYVEYRDKPFRVAGLGEEARLAPNLVVLVTMNPNDRSVINLDDAVVRRLRSVDIPPSTTALRQILDDAGMSEALRDEVVAWFEGLPSDVPFGHGLFVGVASERDLHNLWHEQIRFFLRRGGITVYPNPSAIESGYKWRAAQFSSPGEQATEAAAAAGELETGEAPSAPPQAEPPEQLGEPQA
jgi:5-methylcytosine-specific restriction protein B